MIPQPSSLRAHARGRSAAFRSIALLLVGVTLACGDSGPTGPEVDEMWSFEDGFEGWSLGRTSTTDAMGLIASGGASDGDSYFEATLLAPAEIVWVSRSFQLDPDVVYDVDFTVHARTFEGSGVMAFAASDQPIAPTDFEGGDAVPGPWTSKTFTMEEFPDAQGRIWVAVGVGSSIAGAGRFGLDRVEVRIRRQ